jgi:murein L,D-transpeptidase YafK
MSLSLKIAFLLCLWTISSSAQQTFKEKQLSYSRVKLAYDEKYEDLTQRLSEQEIDIKKMELFLLCFKEEMDIEVWAKNQTDNQYKHVLDYNFCALSGGLGPKRQEGDLQVPEGFYHINVFNPWSNFHLSLGINYPNKSDRILGVQGKLGGDIYIHGSCVTIGCIPIRDYYIKELYILCVQAKDIGHEIPVHILPAKLDSASLERIISKENPDTEEKELWNELYKAYQYIIDNKMLPDISFLNDGRHDISQ